MFTFASKNTLNTWYICTATMARLERGIPAWLLLFLCCLGTPSSGTSTTTDSGTTQSTTILKTTSTPCPCVNGECTADREQCDCGPQFHFDGPLCEVINMSTPSVHPSSRTVTFRWNTTFHISSYSFVFKAMSLSKPAWQVQPVFRWMKDRQSLLMVGLEPTTNYTICIVHDVKVSNITAGINNKTENDTDCVATATRTSQGLAGAHFITFWVCVSFISAVPLVLLVMTFVRLWYATKVETLPNEKENDVNKESIEVTAEAVYPEKKGS